MSTQFQPMLAVSMVPEKLKFPVCVQTKIDGIRCVIKDGKALSRTLKEIPNREIFNALSKPEYEGLDGELVVGEPTASDCYRTTVSFVMAPNKTGQKWTFYVFDVHDHSGKYIDREAYIFSQPAARNVEVMSYEAAVDMDELRTLEAKYVELGYEGIIVRGPDTFYKYGRSSPTKGELLKVKLYQDAEAEIIGVEEEMHNGNEAVTNALGRTERSTVQANKVGKGTLGALVVRDLKTNVEFKVGTGFDFAQRSDFWEMYHKDAQTILGKTIKYKFLSVGVKEKPRHPVFLGLRDMEIDG